MSDPEESWIDELLRLGAIVQDSDDSVPWPEREERFNRYVGIVDAVRGDEGVVVARALIQSMKAPQDYGAYQATQRAIGRFPTALWVQALVCELPSLIHRQPDWAGELLCGLANSVGTRFEPDITEFRRQLAAAPVATREVILAYIQQEERDGWLKHRVGVLS